jgi:hypothetical protein
MQMEVIRFIFSFSTGFIMIGAIPRMIGIVKSAPEFIKFNQIADLISVNIWVMSLATLVAVMWEKSKKWK